MGQGRSSVDNSNDLIHHNKSKLILSEIRPWPMLIGILPNLYSDQGSLARSKAFSLAFTLHWSSWQAQRQHLDLCILDPWDAKTHYK